MAHESLPRLVRKLTSHYTATWFNASGNPPLFHRRFSLQEQRQREKQIDALRHKEPLVRKQVMAFIAHEIQGQAGARLRRFLEDCGRAGEKFVEQARKFDPNLCDADIEQALRNVWVFNSLQFYLDKPVSLTPSAFAYSLLYPYTDNCLDGKGEPGRGRQALLRWLTLQLSGRPEPADDSKKAALSLLLGMIRKEHPRSRRPDVHESLLAIHQAQQKGLQLHGSGAGKTEHGLIPLTIAKGGASVLVDGFLAGRLDDNQIDAVFGYGVLLQLVDDLQDLQEDVDGGQSTPFSRAIRHGTLEGITNRLFNLSSALARQLKMKESSHSGNVSMMVERSCMLLIQEAIAHHSHLYRKGYLRYLKEFMPVRLRYLRTVRSR